MTDDQAEAAEPRPTDPITRFYEAHPYPPPVDDLDSYIEAWDSALRRRGLFHLFFPVRAFQEDLKILVAGCGTSQAAKHAVRWPGSDVLGIDISESSLSHTEALKRKHGLDNLETEHMPIENVGSFGPIFDIVVCTGVIHHLIDPLAGLTALANVLRSDGAMELMVYGAYGRAGLSMLQQYGRIAGVGMSEPEIDELVRTVREIPASHPAKPVLTRSGDTRTYGGIADALLNPREISYTVPQLFELVTKAGLVFGRWKTQAPYRIDNGAFRTTPHYERLGKLDQPSQFEAMELFRGSMTRHTALLYRDSAEGAVQVSKRHMRQAIPIPTPNTHELRDDVPDGFEVVLVSGLHRDPDLYLPLTMSELEVYHSIDGETTAKSIAAALAYDSEEELEQFDDLLNRLWLNDHIQLDLSAVSAGNPE